MERPESTRRFRRGHKLCRSAEFLRCYRRGGRRHGSLLTLHFHPNDARTPRLGITASRKVGKAVVRQRSKRRVREIFRTWEGRSSLGGLDVVVHLKPAAGPSDFRTLRDELERLLAKLPGAASGTRR